MGKDALILIGQISTSRTKSLNLYRKRYKKESIINL
ncbi:hypothetical protein EVA_17820 [gut metagenome]|uniref:Uncharacterized protein n=1 Tax=gut metagenome TaxID=749906 RepID=J9FWY1_9ZZZZ